MLNIEIIKNCTSCAACLNICPKDAISFKSNKEGFSYPHVSVDLCIGCNLCNLACPLQYIGNTKELPIHSIALKNKDAYLRESSSSGGVFFSLAKKTIENGGVVYGAKFNDEWKVLHSSATDMDSLHGLMQSKYSQSSIGKIFRDIKSHLINYRNVLFVGTPCQVSGLNGFLRHKEYNNLVTVELCCHGVPSPGVWKKYIHEEFDVSKIKSINFRSKKNGWRNYSLEIENIDGSIYCKPKMEDPYMRGFLYGLSMRPSCYNCPNKPFNSSADIVIGDYWGVDLKHQDFNDGKGVSLALALTDKGKKYLSKIDTDFDVIDITWDDATSVNGNFLKSTPVNKRRRSFFWFLQSLGFSVKNSVNIALMPYPHSIIKNKIVRICKKLH